MERQIRGKMDFLRVLLKILLVLTVVTQLSCSSAPEDSDSEVSADSASEESASADEGDGLEEDEDVAASDNEVDLDEELAKDEKEEIAKEKPKDDLNTLLSEDNKKSSDENLFESTTTNPRSSIKDLKYLSGVNGGTIAIELSKEANFNLRKGKSDSQYVIEVTNTVLPDRFKRPYITKEFEGPFISFEAYQSPSSSTSRILIQQRQGGQPSARMSGKIIYITAPDRPIQDEQVVMVNKAQAVEESALVLPSQDKEVESVTDEGMALKSKTLYEYLASGNKYYGKKISLEVRGADVRDVLSFISENSGLNMIIDDQITGKISMKLSKIPWDQALLLVLQSKRLGYLRQGNVLRIAPLGALKEEADEANTILESRKRLEELVVKIVAVSYGDATKLATQIQPFLSQRGKTSADARTSSIVITDIPSNIDKIEKLLKSLDTPPPQVLIEGKVVEATDIFSREIGVAWGYSGVSTQISERNGVPINLLSSLQIQPSVPKSPTLYSTVNIGQLPTFGDINATIALYELDSKVKVLSSPRISTLHNVESEITQNQQIPYNQPSSPTSTGQLPPPSVGFKDVKLSLKVTPQVTSDDSVILDLNINRDVPVDVAPGVPPIINSRQARSKVLVKNGQTAVIGGIYQNDNTQSVNGVPFLKDIPILGYLFKSQQEKNSRNELLIFLTPRILSGPISSTIN